MDLCSTKFQNVAQQMKQEIFFGAYERREETVIRSILEDCRAPIVWMIDSMALWQGMLAVNWATFVHAHQIDCTQKN